MSADSASRVLVLTAPFGSGHTQAADAVAAGLRRVQPGAWVRVIEVGGSHSGVEPRGLGERSLSVLASGYVRLVRWAPGGYGWLYRGTAAARDARRAGGLAAAALGGAVLDAVRSMDPHVIVATHPFPGLAAAHLRYLGRLGVPVAVVLTDFWPHPAWVHPGYDLFCVPTANAAVQLRLRGIPARRVSVTGIPIRQGFARTEPRPGWKEVGGDRAGGGATAKVLVMGGSLGMGPLRAVTRRLLALQPPVHVAVVAGRNRGLEASLRRMTAGRPGFEVYGFTDEVPRLMAGASLLVTKPGGLSCSEALACGLPMVLTRPLPGHEEDNARELVASGAALMGRTPGQVAALVRRLLVDAPAELERLRRAAAAAGRPQAAEAIAAPARARARAGAGGRHPSECSGPIGPVRVAEA